SRGVVNRILATSLLPGVFPLLVGPREEGSTPNSPFVISFTCCGEIGKEDFACIFQDTPITNRTAAHALKASPDHLLFTVCACRLGMIDRERERERQSQSLQNFRFSNTQLDFEFRIYYHGTTNLNVVGIHVARSTSNVSGNQRIRSRDEVYTILV